MHSTKPRVSGRDRAKESRPKNINAWNKWFLMIGNEVMLEIAVTQLLYSAASILDLFSWLCSVLSGRFVIFYWCKLTCESSPMLNSAKVSAELSSAQNFTVVNSDATKSKERNCGYMHGSILVFCETFVKHRLHFISSFLTFASLDPVARINVSAVTFYKCWNSESTFQVYFHINLFPGHFQ